MESLRVTAMNIHRGRSVVIVITVALIILFLGIFLPQYFITEYQEEWDAPREEAAKRARSSVRYDRSLIQKLTTTQISVISVSPDPLGCDWGYATPTSGVARVQTYTIFGIPAEQWTVTCSTSNRTASPWWMP